MREVSNSSPSRAAARKPFRPQAIRRVDPAEALADWDWYEEQINRVIEKADSPHTADDLLSCIQLSQMALWRTNCGRGMGLTQVQNYPRYRRLLIYIVAGYEIRAWIATAHHDLQDFAKSQLCSQIEIHGRPGWEPMLRRLGYDRKMIRMRMTVEN